MCQRLWFLVYVVVSVQAFGATPDADVILSSGRLDAGIVELQSHLKVQPKDDVARFGLGVTQFVRAVQQLGQKLAVFGPRPRFALADSIDVADVPVPAELLTYAKLRTINQEWLDDLAKVEATLSKVQSEEVKLPLHVGRVALNLGTAETRSLTLIPILRNFRLTPDNREGDFTIVFDRADVDWLRGYCHLLAAVSELALAYDAEGLFDVASHRLFQHAQTRHTFLLESPRSPNRGWFGSVEEISDLIAIIHMIRFPVIEPSRTSVALKHIEDAVGLSRQMWKRILAETDDDREWIPSPKQSGAINVKVTQEMVDNWTKALDEAESVLQGKKLIPFWRGKPNRGVNVRKIFLEPLPFDLVLWGQGTAATPYLEEGILTAPETWQQINRAFGGQFFGFGLWFN
ncbi:MAG: hypothetical protein NTW52_13270 [Planctomycetota bacterium]|nr:hypothetical protein [Planctomycetota bacterium]